MAADVKIRRWTGAAGAETKSDISGINTRANAEDAHSTAGVGNSVLVPTSGVNYSYWVSTRLYINAITGGTVNNIRWYTDGTNNFGTGVTCKAQTATGYVQASGTPGTSGNQLTTGNHASLSAAPVDAFTFTSGSPKSITGSSSATGDVGDFMVYQLEVDSTALSGASSQEVFTFKYDDTSS
jgi:hypothetical protein